MISPAAVRIRARGAYFCDVKNTEFYSRCDAGDHDGGRGVTVRDQSVSHPRTWRVDMR